MDACGARSAVTSGGSASLLRSLAPRATSPFGSRRDGASPAVSRRRADGSIAIRIDDDARGLHAPARLGRVSREGAMPRTNRAEAGWLFATAALTVASCTPPPEFA